MLQLRLYRPMYIHKLDLSIIKQGVVARSNAPAWYADGRGLDPHVRRHFFVGIGHEIISKTILSLPLIQERQLSVTGEIMCMAAQKQCG